ncbi:unnamed protein product [Gongylonema pulchrum]|uniref:IMD domain-containing protein n=1 Tax=Gongylonema pulchrum TaxID=637853 RepID=A0A183DUZ9_9BILA|nr:unnamed protein product [Gongylonema pulchrum]
MGSIADFSGKFLVLTFVSTPIGRRLPTSSHRPDAVYQHQHATSRKLRIQKGSMNTGTSAWPSTSSAATSSAQQPGHPDMAQKVSEIFMKAGEAFQELGSLVAVLQSKDDNERLVSEIFMKAGEAFQELGSLVAVLQSKDDNERHLMRNGKTRRSSAQPAASSLQQRIAESGLSRPAPVKRTANVPQTYGGGISAKRRFVSGTSNNDQTVAGTLLCPNGATPYTGLDSLMQDCSEQATFTVMDSGRV